MARQPILTALHAYLEAYNWQTFSPEVYLGRSVFFPGSKDDPGPDPLPVLTVLPGQETAEHRYGGYDQITLDIGISAFISLDDGQDILEICEPVFAEMKKAMFTGVLTVATEQFTLQYTSGGILEYPPELGPFVAQIGVNAQLQYTTDHNDTEE